MPKIQPTLTVNLDDKVLVVENLSQQTKALISVYDEWRQKLVDAQDEVQLISTALQVVTTQLRDQIVKETTPEEQAANDAAPVAQ